MTPSPTAARAIRSMHDAQKALLELEKSLQHNPPTEVQLRQLAETGGQLHRLLTILGSYL